jgi:16S rRNA (cytidine1402-2'-O)-methyltransferase
VPHDVRSYIDQASAFARRPENVLDGEDTRTTAKLLARHSIRTPLVALFGRSGTALVERIKAGGSIALVSESGTPGISDPGAHLVAPRMKRAPR